MKMMRHRLIRMLTQAVLVAPQFREMIRKRRFTTNACHSVMLPDAILNMPERGLPAEMTTVLFTAIAGALAFRALTPGADFDGAGWRMPS
jgi:hypothetical protein